MTSRHPQPRNKNDDITQRLATLGARYDAAPLFPVDSLQELVVAGLHRRFAPPSCGGARFANERERHDDIRAALQRVGRGDLSIGRLYEGHVNAMMLFGWLASESQLSWLGHALDRGAWFGVWATEPAPGVRIDDDNPKQLAGEKMFASGAGGLDYALVTVACPGTERRLAIVPANEPDRTDLSGWRVRGMRASASGRYRLDAMPLEAGMLLGNPGDYDVDPRFTAGAWRFCAVQLGGIEALIAEVARSMTETTRADPVQRARFAEAVVAVRTAGFWVTEAARRTADDDHDAIAMVRLTRGVVEQAGFTLMEAAARLIGTRSAFDGERSDKIIRDLSLYLRQAGPDYARDQAALALLDADIWPEGEKLW